MPPERSISVNNNFIAKVKDLQQKGITERMTQPTEWVSAFTVVNKPSAKNEIRLCIDSIPLNTLSNDLSTLFQLLIICPQKLAMIEYSLQLISRLHFGVRYRKLLAEKL